MIYKQEIADFARQEANRSQIISSYSFDHQSVEYGAIKGAQWAISQMQPEWVSVADRLPESMSDVICHLKNGYVTKLTYGEISGFFDSFSGISATSDNPVIDWMPLPQPPTK